MTRSKLTVIHVPRLFLMLGSLILSGCGGSGSDDPLRSSSDLNVALSGTASADFDDANAGLVNDGITASASYWAGNALNDAVEIDFGELKDVSEIRVYTNKTSYDAMNPELRIELSVNGASWLSTAQPAATGADLECSTYSSNADRIGCVLANRIDVQYVRVRTINASNPGSVFISEIQVFGR